MKALLAQLEPAADPERDTATVVSVIGDHPDADLALFPELFIGGYVTADPSGVALKADSTELTRIGVACRESQTAAIVGFTESLGDGRFANSAACFDRTGGLASIYRKTQVFGGTERVVFEPGDDLKLVTLGGLPTGPLICFDMEFPEPARELALKGARLLVTIAANMAPYGPDHRLAGQARALDNRLPHLYVNRVGSTPDLNFVGGSRAIGRNGEILFEAGDQEEVIEVDLEIEEPLNDSDVNYLQHLREKLDVTIENAPSGGGS